MSIKDRRKENISYLENEYQYIDLVKSMFQEIIYNNEIYIIDLFGIDVYKNNKLYGTREVSKNKKLEIWEIYDTHHTKKLTYYPYNCKIEYHKDIFEEYKEITQKEVNELLSNQYLDIKERRKEKRKTKKQKQLQKEKRELLLKKMKLNQILRDMDFYPDYE